MRSLVDIGEYLFQQPEFKEDKKKWCAEHKRLVIIRKKTTKTYFRVNRKQLITQSMEQMRMVSRSSSLKSLVPMSKFLQSMSGGEMEKGYDKVPYDGDHQ